MCAAVLSAQPLSAQVVRPAAAVETNAAPDTTQADAIRAYLDCQGSRCDYDFMRDQIRWVNWVRDRLFADVQLLVTSLRTGAGGTEYTVAAIGVNKYKGRADTTVVFVNPNDADDVARRSLARTFSLLLAFFEKDLALSRVDAALAFSLALLTEGVLAFAVGAVPIPTFPGNCTGRTPHPSLPPMMKPALE